MADKVLEKHFIQKISFTLLCSAKAHVLNLKTIIILKRKPLPDATPNMATIRGYIVYRGHLSFTVF